MTKCTRCNMDVRSSGVCDECTLMHKFIPCVTVTVTITFCIDCEHRPPGVMYANFKSELYCQKIELDFATGRALNNIKLCREKNKGNCSGYKMIIN